MWGNYCNVLGGATPVNIYYSTDNGQTVKIAYAFGQNPHFRDDGSPGGGTTGTLLGDARNPVICRHVHSVAYNPAENAFYACTGDGDRAEGHECHWLRGTYDAKKDKWQWKVIVSDQLELALQVRRHQLRRREGLLDQRRERPRAARPRHLPLRPGRHRQSPDAHAAVQSAGRIRKHDHSGRRDPGVALCARLALGHGDSSSPRIMGKTWAQYDLKEFGKRSPTRFHEKNSEGWFRVDLRSGWIEHAEVLFIKPKHERMTKDE